MGRGRRACAAAGGSSRSAPSAAARRSCSPRPPPSRCRAGGHRPPRRRRPRPPGDHARRPAGPARTSTPSTPTCDAPAWQAACATSRHALRVGAATRCRGAVDLLYVDGAHRYAPARADIERWGARVAPAGTDAHPRLVQRDRGDAGPAARCSCSPVEWRYCGRGGSLAEYRRERLDRPRWPSNACRQLGGLPYFARNMAIKVAALATCAPVARLLATATSWPY